MNLAEALATETGKAKPCGLARRTEGLLGEDVVVLLQYLSDDKVSSGSIKRALGRIGVFVSDDTIRKHRAGECSCERV